MRTVVVGSGGAGAPLAARLSGDADRAVTMIEAGSGALEAPAELLDGGALRGAAPDHPANWAYPAELAPGVPAVVARGRILDGSTAINGGYFTRAAPSDFGAWAAAGGAGWTYERALPLLRALERDLDYGASPVHGDRGPMPVSRPPQSSAATALRNAALELGFPDEPDKNAGSAPGIGPVPSNILDGVRVSTAAAYLAGARDRLEILGDTRVLRVVLEASGEGPRATGSADRSRPRAIGVETDRGFIEADEVVLAAGAIATPQLLMLSGIGPREHLEEFGIGVAADLPVGRAFSDHPNLALEWRTARPIVDWDAGFGFPTALNFDSASGDPSLGSHPQGDLEILLASKPLGFLLTGVRPAEETLQFLIALQDHSGRGRLSLASADPLDPPRIEYRYLEREEDRRRLRVGVRTAVRLLRSRAFGGVFGGLTDLGDAELGDDDALDAWILRRLGTALHTCGTAPMGEVVDGEGRVRGVDGLRVADTSILPSAPHRGPANTAVFIGELIARRMLGDSA